MRRARHLVAAVAAIAAVAIGDAAPATADVDVRGLATIMTGAAEVPGPGDPDGFGFAGLLVKPDQGRICYALVVKRIAPATAAHIHVGAADVAGPVVVPLDAPSRGFSANCASVDPALAAAIAATPDQYYVNVHNAEFPAGAIRGQLG